MYQLHLALCALGEQHIENCVRRVIAEKLAQSLLMPRDAVPLHKFKKMPRLIERQRRLGKVRIFRKESIGRAMKIGEVAAPAAGDQNLASRLCIVFKKGHAASALRGNRGAHQPGSTRAQHNYVELARLRRHRSLSSIAGLSQGCVCAVCPWPEATCPCAGVPGF